MTLKQYTSRELVSVGDKLPEPECTISEPYIDITPTMTGYNTPAPYITSCSSEYDDVNNRVSWTSFNQEVDSIWISEQDKHIDSWITLDFGKVTRMSRVALKNVNYLHCTTENCMPRIFEIQCSSNGEDFDTIRSIDLDKNDPWSFNEERIFDFPYIAEYRYLRLLIKEPYGKNTASCNFAIVGKVKVYCGTPNYSPIYVNVKSSFKNRCLPMNTTSKILSKFKDNREGLLGMANDGNNYGTLYVVGPDGKSHLTKSATLNTKIYSGTVSSGAITLSKDLTEFTFLSFSIFNGSETNNYATCNVLVSDLLLDKKKIILESNANYSMWLTITDNKNLSITSNTDITIKEIYGIK